MTVSPEAFALLHSQATKAAAFASNSLAARYKERYGAEDVGACGFAWVEVFGVRANSKLGKAMTEVGFRKGYGKGAGMKLWNPGKWNGQNIDIKEAGANEYATVLSAAGLKAYSGSNLD